MKKEELQKLTKEELQQKEKHLKFANHLLIGILLPLFIFTLIDSIQEKILDPLLVTSLLLAITVPLNFRKLKLIRSELQQRAD